MQEQWTIKELLEWTTRFFTTKGIAESRLEAEVLLARVLENDRVYLYTHYDKPVNQNERLQFREFIKKRAKGEPLAYIVGHKEFMSLEFKVSPAVLIPRPDTELLVEKILELVRGKNSPRICDVGTGSGAIAVSLAFYLTDARVWAIDISSEALQIARENASRHRVEIEFHQGDLLLSLENEELFDVIAANLPYVTENEWQQLEPGVKDYEPQSALIASGDGLDIYRRLLPQARTRLKSGGHVLLEIGYRQGEAARDMMQGFEDVQIIKDLAGRDRLVMARKG